MDMNMSEDDFLKELQIECLNTQDEFLDQMREGMADFSKDVAKATRTLLKALHSLKGNLQAAGIPHCASYVHQLEERLFEIELGSKDGSFDATNLNSAELLLSKASDQLDNYFSKLKDGEPDSESLMNSFITPVNELLVLTKSVRNGGASTPEPTAEVVAEAQASTPEPEPEPTVEVEVEAAASTQEETPPTEEVSEADKWAAEAEAAEAEVDDDATAASGAETETTEAPKVAAASEEAPAQEPTGAEILPLDEPTPEPEAQPTPVVEASTEAASTESAPPSPDPPAQAQEAGSGEGNGGNGGDPPPEEPTSAPVADLLPDEEPRHRQYLLCKNYDRHYAININHIVEIVKSLPISPLPHQREDLVGLLNLRSEALPILNLKSTFDYGENKSKAPSKQFIVVSKIDEKLFGFQVDEVNEVVSLNEVGFQDIKGVPSKNGSNLVKKISYDHEKTILVVDLEQALLAA